MTGATATRAETPLCPAQHPEHRHRWCGLARGHDGPHASPFGGGYVDGGAAVTTDTVWTEWEPKAEPTGPRWVVDADRPRRAHVARATTWSARWVTEALCGTWEAWHTKPADPSAPKCKRCLAALEREGKTDA